MAIIVVGDVMLDKYLIGTTSRISPEAPVPVVKFGSNKYRLGGASNVALNIMNIYEHVLLCGIIGKDENGEIIKQLCDKYCLRTDLTTDASSNTIVKKRIIANNYQVLRIDYEDGFKAKAKLELFKNVKNIADDFQIAYYSDYAKSTLYNISEHIALFNNKKIKVIVDPKGKDFKKYSGAFLLKPNYKEYIDVVGNCSSEKEIITKGRKLMRNLNISNLLITRGQKGLTLIPENGDAFNLISDLEKESVVDVTGAGDTFGAILSVCLDEGRSVIDSARIANKAAGLVVQKFGTSCVTITEYEELITSIDSKNKLQKIKH